MILPLFINKKNRYQMALLCAIAFFVGYSVPNHYHLYQPQLLDFLWIDHVVPMVPWTIFIYIGEYVLFVTAYFMFRDELNRNRYIWSYFGVLMFAIVVFVLYPVTYPRADFPIPPETHRFTAKVFNTLRMIDDPSNCLPSLHVACCYLTAFAFLPRTESRVTFWTYFLWATAIGASTLTTKQHYFVDVISGVALSLAGYYIFFKKIRYVPVQQFIRNLTERQRA